MVFPILYCFSIAFALGQLHTITSLNRDRKRNAVTYHDLSFALALGLGFQWISMDFSRILHRNSALEIQTMLRLEPTKPASLSRKGHRFCPAFWLSFWSFNTLLVKWRHVLTLLEKNRFCCAKIMGLVEIAWNCCSMLPVFVHFCYDQLLVSRAVWIWKWEHIGNTFYPLGSRYLQILQNANLLQFKM